MARSAASVPDSAPSLHRDPDLRRAIRLLESPSLSVKLVRLVGSPLEKGLDALPSGLSSRIESTVSRALSRSYDTARWTLRSRAPSRRTVMRHRLSVLGSGAVGGVFGLPGLLVELPVTTTLMMRSILELARQQGMDPQDPFTRVACLEVFALGDGGEEDRSAREAYYALRELSEGILSGDEREQGRARAAGNASAATLARLVQAVSARFGLVMTQKAATQVFPLLGAVTAATLNTVFIRHFQRMAEGHFLILKLEQEHGAEAVRQAWARGA